MTDFERNFELLRPFNVAAATHGERICNALGLIHWDYVAGPDPRGNLVVRTIVDGWFVNPVNCPASSFRMAPLAWVEGTPMYKGDRLWHINERKWWIADCIDPCGLLRGRFESDVDKGVASSWAPSIEYLTWSHRAVKHEGWLNLYLPSKKTSTSFRDGNVFDDKESADRNAKDGRVACIPIEWEE